MRASRRVVLGTALAAPAVLRRAWAQPSPVPVGALYPFSGVLSLLGDESYRGLELAVDERNGSGGLLGRPVKLLKGDAIDPNAAVAEARRLTATEKVALIFGTCASSLVFAASQISELAGTPYFELGAISDAVTDRGFHYLFRSCPVASAFAEVAVETLSGKLPTLWGVAPQSLKIAILHEDGLYGSTVSGLQQARCKEAGLNVVDNLAYSPATADLGSAVQRLRGADTDVVLHTGYQNDVVLFFRQMKQVGWLPRMVIGAGGGYALNDTASGVGSDFEGAMNVGFTPYQVNDAAAPGVGEVEAAYQRKYGAKPRSGHSLANFAGAKLFLDAVERAGSLENDKIRATVLATDIAVGGLATGWGARFDDKGQNTRARPFLLQWQGGAERTVAPPEAAVAPLRPKLGG
ncbi:MAG: ABC transporter substrate-binding protein [Acetobacteraceae bacterium]|nr:ABC transporter substrate-binding protein [Acetobacteraceae bacterium]